MAEEIYSSEKEASSTAKDTETVAVLDDPAAPSPEVSSKRQSLSDLFTIVCLSSFSISLVGDCGWGSRMVEECNDGLADRLCSWGVVLLWVCVD